MYCLQETLPEVVDNTEGIKEFIVTKVYKYSSSGFWKFHHREKIVSSSRPTSSALFRGTYPKRTDLQRFTMGSSPSSEERQKEKEKRRREEDRREEQRREEERIEEQRREEKRREEERREEERREDQRREEERREEERREEERRRNESQGGGGGDLGDGGGWGDGGGGFG